MFQIPEGTFGTGVGGLERRPVWRRFKSRKERLGLGMSLQEFKEAERFQIPEGTFGTPTN